MKDCDVRSVRIRGWDGSNLLITDTPSNPSLDEVNLLDPLQTRCRIMGYTAVGCTTKDVLIQLSEKTNGTVIISLDISACATNRGGTAFLDLPSDGVLFNTGVLIAAFNTDGTALTDQLDNSIAGITLFYQV